MSWHCKATGYYKDDSVVLNYPDADGMENCDQIYYILARRGWTVQAIVGLLVCIGFESGYNPWKWQGSIVPSTSNYTGTVGNKGYGLVQWDPGSYNNLVEGDHQNKYIDNPYAIHKPGYGPNFSDVVGSYYDGYAQMLYLNQYGHVGQYYDSYNTYYSRIATTFTAYRTSTADCWDLCETWTQNFERAQGSLNPQRRAERQTLAQALWPVFNGKPVLPPDQPDNIAWLLFIMKANNFGGGII